MARLQSLKLAERRDACCQDVDSQCFASGQLFNCGVADLLEARHVNALLRGAEVH